MDSELETKAEGRREKILDDFVRLGIKKEDAQAIDNIIIQDKELGLAVYNVLGEERENHKQTALHSLRCLYLAYRLGEEFSFKERYGRRYVSFLIGVALHDMGKRCIYPASLLNKPKSQMTKAEREVVIDKHPEEGAKDAKALGFSEEICYFIGNHQLPKEKLKEIKKKDGFLFTLALVELFDACLAKREYRTTEEKALNIEDTFETIDETIPKELLQEPKRTLYFNFLKEFHKSDLGKRFYPSYRSNTSEAS